MANILLPVHKCWIDKILAGEKPFDFRSILPKSLLPGDIIYLYETSKKGGSKMVVGEVAVEDIWKLTNESGKYPLFGSYHFIDYYFEHIKKDTETANTYKAVKKEFENKSSNYRYGFIVNYALCPEELESLRATGALVDTTKLCGNYLTNNYLKRILDGNDKSDKAMVECDAWLSSIGFYDESDESRWKYAIKIVNPIRYETPLPLSSFRKIGGGGEILQKAPQSFCYVEKIIS